MGSELIINATLPETRIALLEGGEIQELWIERETQRGIVGNIYKGKVLRVLPGMQAAFVDIGQDKAAFLYVDDIFFPDTSKPLNIPGEEPAIPQREDELDEGAEEVSSVKSKTEAPKKAAPAPTPLAAQRVIDLTGGSSAPAEEPTAQEVIPEELVPDVTPASEDDDEDEVIPRRSRVAEGVSIQDLVKEGQDILVQVAKDPIGTKGARLTCHVSLPGRYLVFMPTVDHVGVSRRIENDGERRRLKTQIMKYRPDGTGFIVRTASSTQDEDKIKDDIDYLVRNWNDVLDKYRRSKSPTLIYQDYTLVIRAIRDMVTDEVDRLVVDSRSEFKQIQKFVQRFMPNLKSRIELYEKATPIFDYFGIEIEIQRALDRKVWLKSGGYLVIDQSEALVAIDVNTGRFVGKKNLEDTILKTNLEAVKEIAYQLRLRNCGGIIVLDLIDMERESNREKVYQALEEALKKDRARPTILKISQLGLVEMTRKRTRDSTVRTLCEPCPYCEGRGFVKNKLTMAYEIMRAVEREGSIKETNVVTVECNTSVAEILGGDKDDIVMDLERRFSKKIIIKANVAYHLEQYEIVATRDNKAFIVKESRKDARGLGDVRSVQDEVEEHGTVAQRLRKKEWDDSVGISDVDLDDTEEVLDTLTFSNEEQKEIDGNRELRDERGGERGRRNRRPSKGKRKDSNRSEQPRVENKRIIALNGTPASSEAQNLDNEDSSEDSSEEFAEENLSSENEGAEYSGEPRNYEEYILTAPEAGTEMTRAEWEASNQHKRKAGGPGGRPHSGGHRNHFGKHRHNKHRRHRRGGRHAGGGNRSQTHA